MSDLQSHIAREVYQFVISTPIRLPLGLEPPYWSFRYYGLKSVCAECVDLNSGVLRRLTYESVAFARSHTTSVNLL